MVDMSLCLHVLFRVVPLLHSNWPCEGMVIWGMFPVGVRIPPHVAAYYAKGGGVHHLQTMQYAVCAPPVHKPEPI